MHKFKRSARERSSTSASDEEGQIQVVVKLVVNGHAVKGNRSRCITIKDARVSEVFDAIEEYLLE